MVSENTSAGAVSCSSGQPEAMSSRAMTHVQPMQAAPHMLKRTARGAQYELAQSTLVQRTTDIRTQRRQRRLALTPPLGIKSLAAAVCCSQARGELCANAKGGTSQPLTQGGARHGALDAVARTDLPKDALEPTLPVLPRAKGQLRVSQHLCDQSGCTPHENSVAAHHGYTCQTGSSGRGCTRQLQQCTCGGRPTRRVSATPARGAPQRAGAASSTSHA
mmetsp:Transcript_49388/g.136892  ORF Transcript_49388/g.136892 Transcript_49388/m.136892 type:complete len:219 (+) Transcript_49388:100-756(+)